MSECSIDAYDDCLSCEFSHSEIRKARKPHQCHECLRDINIGEKYEYHVGKFEGDFTYSYTCMDCKSLRDTFFCSWIFERVWEDFFDWFDDWWYTDSKELYKLENLTPKARNKVFEHIAELEEEEYENEENS